MIVTDNGDSEKVLATVVTAVYAFCDQFPKSLIYATGSTEARTRLYKMGINKYFEIIHEDFKVFGLAEREWERIIKGADYRAFAVQRKSINLKNGSTIEQNEKKVHVVCIDKVLNKYDNVVLFPYKVKKAKENFEKFGLPDLKKHNHLK